MNFQKIFTTGVVLALSITLYAQRMEQIFDAGWQFALGDFQGAEKTQFNDTAWRTLDLPHDWAFEADYAEDAAQTDKGGYKPGGIGWYRKPFDLPEDWLGKCVSLEFDAVFMNSEVWINGNLLGKRPYGYISFDYDLTKHLKPGKNIIALRVDSNLEPAARWYHGCGIYSHVKLVAAAPVHVAKDGVFIQTPKISDSIAEVLVETELRNTTQQGVHASIKTTLFDPSGREVATDKAQIELAAGKTATLKQALSTANPMRWDTATPQLYKAVSCVVVDNQTVDEVTTKFGIRSLRWEADTGFWLNDRNVKLRGVCDHLECGPVGAAVPDELNRWKIQLLKDMGCNAIRVAHNPQTPVFYDLCDELGMLVMDEIFDGWKKKANEDYGKQAFATWWERDLRSWLKRDRNHPSVIIWSLGNETGGAVAPELVKVCHEMDPGRLTTSGHSGSAAMDVLGMNGHSEKRHFFEKAPDKPFVSTEAPHTWQVRGFYRSKTWFRDGYPNKRQDPFECPDLTEDEIFTYDWTAPENKKNRKQIFNSSYDNGMVRITARKNWELVRDLPWHGGHFRWTGFDYLGEAGYVHGGWPFRAFMGGPLDLAGFKKDLFFFYQSQWTTKPMIHILPHWTHPKMNPGTKIPLWVYSNCDEVELFLNGKSLGKDRPGTKWNEMQCEWMVPWRPGTIEAVGYKNGKEILRTSQTTAGVPAQLKLRSEGIFCPIITVTATDNKGVMNPYAENRIHYHIDGPARILSLESGNPVNIENNVGRTSRTTFFGLGRAFLRTTKDSGEITVIAGAICGEKQLMTSRTICIAAQTVAVRGKLKKYNLKIRYSTDGSKPSEKYTAPFEVKPGTTVKAEVYNDSQLLFSMSERFAPDEGIYWGGTEKTPAATAGGDQAEEANFKEARIATKGKGFNGRGYLDFGHNQDAYVEWYQENDGGAGTATLSIRYSGNARGRKGRNMKLSINGKPFKEKLFFPNTKNYGEDWKHLTIQIPLKRGANTIRLTTIENGGMCLDEITVK